MPLRLRDRLEGGMLGLLVGDAVGVPYEFHSPLSLPPREQIDLVPPIGFRRAHPDTPVGTWSDDGAQALCLLASLLHCGRLDPADLGRRIANWANGGYLAVDHRVFDIGNATAEALHRINEGASPEAAGATGVSSNGNGSLMRSLPLALWHTGSDEELMIDAMRQSRVTHGHLRSQLSCAIYCLWARYQLQEHPDAWEAAVRGVGTLCESQPEWQDELRTHVLPAGAYPIRGTGYVVDCLHSSRAAVRATSYEDCIRDAIALGHDTDTTACVAGGIAGLIHGVSGIPNRWREGLRGMEVAGPMIAELLRHRMAA